MVKTVGSTSFTVAAGHTIKVTVPLNALGRKLAKRFKRLPVLVTISLRQPNGHYALVSTHKTTVKPPKPKHRRRHRH